jgi:hypothetical protein
MSSRSIAVLTPDDEGFLTQAAVEVREHLVASSIGDIRHRYAAGQVVNRVRESVAFGEAGVKLLAKSAHVEAKTLYGYGKVAAAFAIEDIASAEEMAATNDTILQFSILGELAAVADDEQRRMLLQKAIESRWTVRQLRREMAEFPDSTRRPKKEKSLAQLTTQVSKLAIEIERRLEHGNSGNIYGATHQDEHEGLVGAFNSLQSSWLKYLGRLTPGDPREETDQLDDEARSA